MGRMVSSFRELRVYRLAFEAASVLYAQSKAWPKEERYALTDQVRRSSRAVCANIAEAWYKRPYPKHFASKLTDAEAEAGETQAWLDFALDAHLISREQYDQLNARYDRVLGALVTMRRNAARWNPNSTVRDPDTPYDFCTPGEGVEEPLPPPPPPTPPPPPPPSPHPPPPMILILDNYDSFTYNLVHLVARHTDAYEVVRNDALTLDEVRERAYDAVLISPGPGRPEDAGLSEPIIRELGASTPILGVCLGHQAIGRVFGGTVTYAPVLMHGKTSDVAHDDRGVFTGVAQPFTATRYHSLVVAREGLPACLEVSAETPDGTIMGLRHKDAPVEGIQFHPESVLTTEGPHMIENWVRSVAAVRSTLKVEG